MNLCEFLALIFVAGSVCGASGNQSVAPGDSPEKDFLTLIDEMKSNELNALDSSLLNKNSDFMTAIKPSEYYEGMQRRSKENDRKWRFEFARPLSAHSRKRRYIYSFADYQRAEKVNQQKNEASRFDPYAIKWGTLPPWPVPAGFNEKLIWWDWKTKTDRYENENPHWDPAINNNTEDKQILWKEFNSTLHKYVTEYAYKYVPLSEPPPEDPRDLSIWFDWLNKRILVKKYPRPMTTPKPAPDFDFTTLQPTTTEGDFDYTTLPPDPDNNSEPHRRKKRDTKVHLRDM